MQQIKEASAGLKLRFERARSRHSSVDVAALSLKSFSAGDGGSYAAALTYYIFFSLFPLLLVTAATVGWITGDNAALQERLLEAGEGAVPLLSEVLSADSLASIQEQANGLAVTGFLLALYAGSGAIVALEHALNKADGVAQGPGWVQRRVRSLRFLGVFALALVASFGLAGLAEIAPRAFGPVGALAGWTLGRLGGLAVGILLFASAYKVLPVRGKSWKEVLPGAVVAAVAFEILKEVGGWYMEREAQGREATFGTFAVAAGLLVACYLISQVILLCAHVNKAAADRRRSRHSLTKRTEE